MAEAGGAGRVRVEDAAQVSDLAPWKDSNVHH